MKTNRVVVATYKSHDEAAAAVKELAQSGFDMNKISIVGRDYFAGEHVVGCHNTGDRGICSTAKPGHDSHDSYV